MKYAIFSYDIFDTCLLRACGDPLNVFDILAKRILGATAEETHLVDFAKERVDAEQRARQSLADGIEEVTLEDIYECCDFTMWTDSSKESIMSAELRIEKELLGPVCSIREQIQKQRIAGGQIIFISDMYLPERFVLSVLQENGFYKEGDKLYISSQQEKCKSTGHLYEVVKSDCNAQYSRWIHYGDNPHSDVAIPKKYGIKSKQVHHGFTYYESKLKDKDFACRSYSIAYLATISKAIIHKYGKSATVLFAADLIAPLYVSYVYYILNDAKKRHLQHLYFLARDGYLLYCIARKILATSDIFDGIDVNYLYVSRQSLYKPGFEYETGAEENRRQSDLCFRYFHEQGLTRDKSAIIDVRGTRKCHIAINNILQRNGACPVFAYYAEVMGSRVVGGEYDALLYTDRFNRNLYNNYFFPGEIFEQYFSITTQKRTTSYTIENEKVIPVFEEETEDADYKLRCSEINRQVCLDFVQQLSCMELFNFDFKAMFYAAVSVYSDFAMAPLYDYLKALDGLVVSDSQDCSYKLLSTNKADIVPYIRGKWFFAVKIYTGVFPHFWTNYFRLKFSFLRHLQG